MIELQKLLKEEGSDDLLLDYLNDIVEKDYEEVDISGLTGDKVWSKISELIIDPSRPIAKEKKALSDTKKNRIIPWYKNKVVWGIAASLVILLLAGIGYIQLIFTPGFTQEISGVIVEKSTLPGQKKTITLTDGSTIKLNSNSKISFRQDFTNGGERKVKLDGEAFFEVAKSEKPFIVQAGQVETSVLGTSFNIKVENENKVHVALTTGKVIVKNTLNKDHILLSPREMVVVEENKLLQKTGFDAEQVYGWKDNILLLQGEDFLEIVGKLEHWYGVEIEVNGEVRKRRFDERYLNEPLSIVLEGLSFSAGFNYVIEGNKVVLTIKK